jgi:hypothetical protein
MHAVGGRVPNVIVEFPDDEDDEDEDDEDEESDLRHEEEASESVVLE